MQPQRLTDNINQAALRDVPARKTLIPGKNSVGMRGADKFACSSESDGNLGCYR